MIETPLDTLGIRRDTFLKALYDGVGLSESASEYIGAYSIVTKMDLYHQPVYNEDVLLMIAKEEVYGEDFFADDPQFTQTYRQQGQNISAEGSGFGGTSLDFATQYRRDTTATNFDNAPSPTTPVQDVHHLQPQNNPVLNNVSHKFSNGSTHNIPSWYAALLKYYTPSEDDKFHAGMSRAEYDHGRIAGWTKDGQERVTPNVTNSGGIMSGLHQEVPSPTVDGSNFRRLNQFSDQYSPLQRIEGMLSEVMTGDFSLKDYLHGFEGLSKRQRDKLYDHLLKNGYDGNHHHAYASNMNDSNIRFNLGLRMKPLMDFLTRPTSHASDNDIAGLETIPEEHDEIPNHVWDSMNNKDLQVLHSGMYNMLGLGERNKIEIEELAKQILEENSHRISPSDALAEAKIADELSYDIFEYSFKNKSFSMNRLGGRPAKDFNDWANNKATKNRLSRSGFYAAVGWDKDRGAQYSLDNAGESTSPVKGHKFMESLFTHFTPEKVKNVERNMKTGRDAIYDGTHMRNHAVPWLSRRLAVDEFGEFMNGDDRGFNDIFSEMFQHGGGHHLDLNNAHRVLAPIFHHRSADNEDGQNLLYDIEHPESYSRRSFIHEDPEKDLYYIAPIEDYSVDSNLGETLSKPIRSSSNALAWAGQPQLTRFFHNIYDPEEFDEYMEAKERGENPSMPKPKRKVMRSLGSIPIPQLPKKDDSDSKAKYDKKKEQRRKLIDLKEMIKPSAHLSQYLSPYLGYARGSEGLTKRARGVHHAGPSTQWSKKDHSNNMRSTNPNKDPVGRRRLSGENSVERGFQSIRYNFRPSGPEAHRKEVGPEGRKVDQQTKADWKKNQEARNRHEATGAGNSPVNPQQSNVLGKDQRLNFNDMASDLFHHHRTRDNVGRHDEFQGEVISAEKKAEKARDDAKSAYEWLKSIDDKLSKLTSSDYDERKKLIESRKGIENEYKKAEKRRNGTLKNLNYAKAKLALEAELPQMTKRELSDYVDDYMLLSGFDSEKAQEIYDRLSEEHNKLGSKKFGAGFGNFPRQENNTKYDADMNAIGLRVQHFRDILDSQGIPIGDDPFEMLSNLMVLAHEAERNLHSYESTGEEDSYKTYNESVADEKAQLHDGGKTHNSIRDLIMTNGQHFGHVNNEEVINRGVGENFFRQTFDNDKGHISEQIINLMRGIQDSHSELPMDKRREIALNTRQMPVRELLLSMHPDLKGDEFNHESSIKHALAMRELLHLDNDFKPTERTKQVEELLGIHFIPARHGQGAMRNMLDGHLIVNPSIDTEGVTEINTPSMKNRMMPISNVSEKGASGINCFFTDPNSHFKWSGYQPTIRAVRDINHKFVKWEKVEPYDYDSRTPPMSIYKRGVPELMGRLGEIDETRLFRPNAFSSLFKLHDETDATLLLASLSDPDIMLKKDGDYPILQPMHRIFKLEDMEHLRGFSGDWIVSAMPEGPRAFVEKKDDKVTVRGDFDLDKETKENFTKISKKDFVVDVVFANKEYNVIDIIEYDDGNVNDMPLQERIKILRGTMESTENVLVPAAHNLRLTDDVGLEIIVKDLLKEHDRLMLRDANSTYMKGEARHPKWVLYDEGRDVNLMVLDKKGTSSYTYRLGTGPITHEDSLGDRAVKYEGDTYMDVGTSFQTKDKYEVGDIVTVNVDSVSVTENVDGADIYTVNSNEIKGEAEGEGVSSVETLSLFTKSEPMMWPHEIDRDGDRIVIKMAAGDVSYRASAIDDEWYMFNPKAENGWLIRLAESQRPFWSPVAGVMLKADLSVIDDETKAEVHESKGDGKPLIPPKKVTGTNFWDDYATDKAKIRRLLAKSLNLVSTMLKSSVGAVGDASSGAQGLGIDYATPIESPSGPTELVGSKTLPDHDVRDIERDNKERAEDKKFNRKETPEGELSIERGKAAFVPY